MTDPHDSTIILKLHARHHINTPVVEPHLTHVETAITSTQHASQDDPRTGPNLRQVSNRRLSQRWWTSWVTKFRIEYALKADNFSFPYEEDAIAEYYRFYLLHDNQPRGFVHRSIVKKSISPNPSFTVIHTERKVILHEVNCSKAIQQVVDHFLNEATNERYPQDFVIPFAPQRVRINYPAVVRTLNSACVRPLTISSTCLALPRKQPISLRILLVPSKCLFVEHAMQTRGSTRLSMPRSTVESQDHR